LANSPHIQQNVRATRARAANANSTKNVYPSTSNTNANIAANANTVANNNDTANTTTRTAYKLPLTQVQKDLINSGKAPLPVSEDNAAFDNNIHGLCGKEACKSAVEAWQSGLSSPQLVTVSDFKQFIPHIKACSKCSNSKNCPKILQSMSAFQSILVIEAKRSVPLFEIRNKT
jgi:hypothetical protein